MITIHKTYFEVTPESAEDGSDSDSGSIGVETVTFRELVAILREHPASSQYPIGGGADNWFSTHPYVSDYGTMTERTESVHFDRSNRPAAAKYWAKAVRAAFRK